MRVRILPSSPDVGHLHHLTTFVVDGHLAVDAGCLGLCGTPREQSAITDVVLSHSHADHVLSLPMYAMNVFDATERGVTVHAPQPVIDSLRRDVFNWRVWPDFAALGCPDRPFLVFEEVALRQPITFGNLTVTPIPVNHPVPTVGYLVDDGASAVLFAVDTGPTEEIWQVAVANPRLAAAFVDAAFPDRLSGLAEGSGHLTPRMLAEQVARLPETVARVAVHLKPAFDDEIRHDLDRAAIPNLSIGCPGREYDF